MRIRLLLGVVFMTMIAGCAVFGGAKSDKLYRSFYLDGNGLRYFIKPIEFKGENADLTIDFNIESNKGDTAVLNFSIFHEKPFKELDSFTISNSNKTTEKPDEIESLFVELKSQDIYQSRFTSKIPNTDIKEIFQNENWVIEVVKSNTSLKFESSRSNQKDIKLINKAVIQLLD